MDVTRRLGVEEYNSTITSPFVDDLAADGVRLLVVDSDDASTPMVLPGSLPFVVCTLGPELGAPGPAAADVVVAPARLDALVEQVAAHPLAATSLAVLLRTLPGVAFDTALASESATYSMLQAGPEFAEWRTRHTASKSGGIDPRGASNDAPAVRVERVDDAVHVVLDRSHRHNAIDRRLRDDLVAALAVALLDPSTSAVVLRGEGPSFCSGGDLDEFGSFPDPATAHVTRLARSPVRLLHRLGTRTTARIHGVAFGGGIELAAAAGTVVAAQDTRIALPEIGLGLIPGAGGTVSLTARIGRQRTAALALTGIEIDATTALAWGLVDRIA